MDRALLEEGKVLVNSVYIRSPQTVAGVRIYYGEDANCIGYPTKDGLAHYVSGGAPLAIRRTATAEEKEVDVERDRATLLHLIETAEPRRQLPRELDDILYEELEQYINGIITEDLLIDHLESRVGLYLNERR